MERETDLALEWTKTDKKGNEKSERRENIRVERDREKNMTLAGINITGKADKLVITQFGQKLF